MTVRVFVKVVGFNDVERHALNSLFRLSEERETRYSLWEPDAPEPPRLALVDGDSPEAAVEAGENWDLGSRVIWVGETAPASAWKSFERPLSWPEVVRAMDELFAPADIDFDLDVDFSTDIPLGPDAVDTQPPDLAGGRLAQPLRALIASPSRDERLYLRARLALAQLTQADEAESGAEALELARDNDYAIALVDFSLTDVDGWALLQELGASKRPIPRRVAIQSRRSVVDGIRAWWRNVDGPFVRPMDPVALNALFCAITGHRETRDIAP